MSQSPNRAQSANRIIATAFGAVYLLVGVLGLFVAGDSFAGEERGLLLGIVGLFLVGTAFNILALNTADHFLHPASAIVLLGTGLALDRSTAGRRAAV